jgi:hypothetical protein
VSAVGGGLHTTDRFAISALALADVGVGLYLVGVREPTLIHTFVGVLALLLAMPAAGAAATGHLVAYSDEGVLLNTGVLAFAALEVGFVWDAPALQVVGMVVLLAASTAATIALYYRMVTIKATQKGRRVRRG